LLFRNTAKLGQVPPVRRGLALGECNTVLRRTMPAASTVPGGHQINVLWHRSDSVWVQGHLPRPDEPTGMPAADPDWTKLRMGTGCNDPVLVILRPVHRLHVVQMSFRRMAAH
jgi:hypothetical protein